ncbi:MAG: tetratricopeptide repeat protein [Gemmatimonadaceae bacterium]|nr:tetratricopeptide repeat protein [Gemmatimonadaceae bacterium]
MLRTRHHSLTRARAAGATLAASALVLAAAACKDSGIKPGQATATPSAPAVVATETTTVPPAEATPKVPANVSYAEAESVFRAKQYGQAADMFAAYTTTHEKNPWGFYMLGLSAWKGGQLDRAQKAFEDALALDPKHVKSLVNLSRVLLEEGKPGDALERATAAIAIDSGSSDAYRVLGRVQTALGRFDDAVDAYHTALTIDPEDVWSMNNMGLLFIQQGRFEEALGPLARAVQLADSVPTFANNLGIALERTGHYTAAAEAYRTALAADSTYEKVRASLARVDGRRDEPGIDTVSVASLGDAFASEVAGWHDAHLAGQPAMLDSGAVAKVKMEPSSDSTHPPER